MNFSESQFQRLVYLGEDPKKTKSEQFENETQRNREFQTLEKKAVKKIKNEIQDFLDIKLVPKMQKLQQNLRKALFENGFAEVSTPTIIPKSYLDKMTIDSNSPLWEQVFKVDKNLFLRPMLAPGLYDVSKKLLTFTPVPLRVFEIGSCYRRESEGKNHLREFTMLNLVEWGTPLDERTERLRILGRLVMEAAGVQNFRFEDENSVVYGAGTDITDVNGIELASSSMGPHKLDLAWGISCTWVGIGFGLERILASKHNCSNISPYARSVSYLNGAALDIK
jgi:phenylalanyl-tRNA synthetase alpha chain